MTPQERAAYHAGIQAVRHAALIAAVTLEVRPDARGMRQQAAIAALQGLADGACSLMLPDLNTFQQAAGTGDAP